MKPGYKTTEFWLTVAAVVVGLLIASGAFREGEPVYQVLTFAASALAAMGYSFSRSSVKKGEAIKEVAKLTSGGQGSDEGKGEAS